MDDHIVIILVGACVSCRGTEDGEGQGGGGGAGSSGSGKGEVYAPPTLPQIHL